MSPQTLVIDRRFRGPPNSGNGGYTCGCLANFIDGPAEVTLRSPPPLDEALAVTVREDGTVEVRTAESGDLVGEARPVDFSPTGLPSVGLDAARQASDRTFPPEKHPLPGCFVCGPHRDPGDGLRIHVGPIDAADTDWEGIVAAPWQAYDEFTDEDGLVRPEFLWAALDCPTAYAVSSGSGMRIILLGRQVVHIHTRPKRGEQCVIVAQRRAHEGRKFFADAAMFLADGSPVAECHALWIEVSPEVQRGAS